MVKRLFCDERERLEEVRVSGATVGAYAYNALGERVSKPSTTGNLHFHYDLNGQLIAESTPTGEVVREYVFADGRRYARGSRRWRAALATSPSSTMPIRQ